MPDCRLACQLRSLFRRLRWSSFFAALALLAFLPLICAPSWLNTSDTPEESDALVVLGGDFTREFFAAELWKQGLASEIYVSQMLPMASHRKIRNLGIPLPTDSDVSRSILLKSGVPLRHIHFFGPSVSTRDEAASLRRVLSGKTRFLIVTSPYHVTRARLIFRQEFDPRQFKVVCTSEKFPKAWWRHQRSARNVILEFLKLVHFELGGSFRISAHRVDEIN